MLKQIDFNRQRQIYSFDIFNEKNEKVGMAQLRLIPSKSTEMPSDFESHVYYEIDEPHRDKGYASKALAELIEVAKKNNLDHPIATVNADNKASIKVIENNGGYIIGQGQTGSGQEVLKYQLY